MTKDKKLDVFYHGRSVGTLALMPDKRAAFQYADTWLKDGFSISPFSLPLNNCVFIPKERNWEYFGGLFGVFADSLPDSWGNLLLDRYLLSIGVKTDDITALDRLAYLGDSGMGALEYRPSKYSDFIIGMSGMDYDDIAGECSKLLSSKESDRIDILYGLGGSSGGTRPKIYLKDEGKEWIVKFPAHDNLPSSGKTEYKYSLCAKKCGIIMTETGLMESRICDGYFKTERFDRIRGIKIHTVTFAGLLEVNFRAPSCDYSTYMKLIKILTKNNMSDLEQLFRIMTFNVNAYNRDDHTKNFSFIYTEEESWRFAPAYDLTYSNTCFEEQTTSVCGKGINITDDDLIKVGTDAGLKKNKCRDIVEEIKYEVNNLL